MVISLKTQFLRSSAFVKFPCVDCKKSVRTNQDAILCGSCTSWFHTKCLGMSKSVFQYYLAHPDIEWTCTFCALPPLSDSFFADISPVDVFSVTAGELGNAQCSGRLTRITSISDLLVFVALVGSSIVLVRQNWSQKSVKGLV